MRRVKNYNTTNELNIYINTYGVIRLHKSVLNMINNPQYIQFWWSESQEVLLLSASEEEAPGSIPINYESDDGRIRFGKRSLLKKLNALNGWKDGTSHKIIGKFIPELTMVAFNKEVV
jgi:hypothetical protein